MIPERRVPQRFAPVLDAVAPAGRALRRGRPPALPRRRHRAGPAPRPRPASCDIDLTTDARPDEIKALLGPGPTSVWTQGERFGTIGAKRRRLDRRDHDPPGRRLPARTPASPSRLLRRRRGATSPAATSPSTPWRWPCPSLQLIDPFDGAADLAAGRLRTPLAPEESFSDDPLRMLRAARFLAGYGLSPTDELVQRRRRDGRPAGDRVGRADPGRARQADGRRATRPPGCGSWSTPAWPRSSCPSCPPCASSRTRSTTTRTCSPTRSPSWPTRGSEPDFDSVRLAALFHDIGKPKTRSFGANGRDVPPPRGGRRPHDQGPDDGAALLERGRRDRHPARARCTCASTATAPARAGPTPPCAASSATPATCSSALIELTRCDCTTRNKRKADDARPAHGRPRGPHRRARGRRGADRPSAPTSTAARSWTTSASSPGREVGEALAFLLELRLDEGPLGEDEAYRRLDAWWAEHRPAEPPARLDAELAGPHQQGGRHASPRWAPVRGACPPRSSPAGGPWSRRSRVRGAVCP